MSTRVNRKWEGICYIYLHTVRIHIWVYISIRYISVCVEWTAQSGIIQRECGSFCNNSCLFNYKTYYSNGIHRKGNDKKLKKTKKLYLSERKYDKRGKDGTKTKQLSYQELFFIKDWLVTCSSHDIIPNLYFSFQVSPRHIVR